MAKKLRIVVSLTTNDNDYQIEQAQSAEQAAARLGVSVEIIYADNDAITQSTQILKAVQASPENRPQVARAAATAGIGWAVLNRDASYIDELRKVSSAPMFAVSSDHVEIGRLQGRQLTALLPKGGSVLYIQGPSENSAAKDRTVGMQETKPANIQAVMLKAQWTEESSLRAVRSWLKLTTSQKSQVDVVAAQDDSMAMGARKAFQELTNEVERERWIKLPFIGCDGLPNTGQAWVKNGQLTATVFVPPNTGQAIEMIVDAVQNKKQPPARVLVAPRSIPALNALSPRRPS
jgi:ribose transport system substrate-binding protein